MRVRNGGIFVSWGSFASICTKLGSLRMPAVVIYKRGNPRVPYVLVAFGTGNTYPLCVGFDTKEHLDEYLSALKPKAVFKVERDGFPCDLPSCLVYHTISSSRGRYQISPKIAFCEDALELLCEREIGLREILQLS